MQRHGRSTVLWITVPTTLLLRLERLLGSTEPAQQTVSCIPYNASGSAYSNPAHQT